MKTGKLPIQDSLTGGWIYLISKMYARNCKRLLLTNNTLNSNISV